MKELKEQVSLQAFNITSSSLVENQWLTSSAHYGVSSIGFGPYLKILLVFVL